MSKFKISNFIIYEIQQYINDTTMIPLVVKITVDLNSTYGSHDHNRHKIVIDPVIQVLFYINIYLGIGR